MTRRIEAIVVGASAGALQALTTVLAPLPAAFMVPIIIVVHLPAGKKSLLAELIQAKCRLSVREVEDKEEIKPGTIYFAPPDYHLLIESKSAFALSVDEPNLFSRPSIDVLFESAADVFGDALMGVVLTGANSDGALGLLTIEKAGGIAVVQDPATAFADAMPEAALLACSGAESMTLSEITERMREMGEH